MTPDPLHLFRDPELAKMARVARWLDASMGQAQAPLSTQSQQLTESLAQQASNTGTATWTFQAPPQGSTWTGTVCCQGAPATAIFLATIGGTNWGDWAGNSVAGPIQCFSNQQLVITAIGLAPGQGYLMEWTGSSDPADLVAPIWPDPNTSAQQVLFGGATTLFGPAVENAGGSFSVNLPPSTRTVLVRLAGISLANLVNVLVAGNVTGLNYYNQFPYLINGTNYLMVMQINGALESSITVTVTATAGYTLQVIGDTAAYQESEFYNGEVQTFNAQLLAAGSSLVLNPPYRLLTLEMEVIGAGNVGTVGIAGRGPNGGTLLRVQPPTVAAGTGTDRAEMTFPPNAIVPTGQSGTGGPGQLSMGYTSAVGGAVVVSGTYAYP